MNRLNLPQNASFRAFFVHLPRSTAVRLRHLLEKSIENPPFCGACNSESFTARIDEAKSADNTFRIDKDFNKVYTAVKLSESGSIYSHSASLVTVVITERFAVFTADYRKASSYKFSFNVVFFKSGQKTFYDITFVL